MEPIEAAAKSLHDWTIVLSQSGNFEVDLPTASWTELPLSHRRLLIAAIQKVTREGWITIPFGNVDHSAVPIRPSG